MPDFALARLGRYRIAALAAALLLVGCAAGDREERAAHGPSHAADQRARAADETSRAASRRSSAPRVEATSLLGRPLSTPPLSEEFRERQQGLLAEARRALQANPDDPDALIWVGRRTAYLGRYGEAIELFGRGIERFPDDARFYRHRGHRYITTRKPDLAIADLERAAELIAGTPDRVEPDGLPNARNTPTSTSHSNIWYHLGLARYLTGDFEGARDAYAECLSFSTNPDMLSATSHWLYMTLRRLGRNGEARALLDPIRADMDIIENHDYHRLLLMYRGELSPDEIREQLDREDAGVGFATTAYGLANWYLYNGDDERATALFERIVAGESWAAFGYIAAEAELARSRGEGGEG